MGAPVVSIFTQAQPHHNGDYGYTWGGWFGTWDNPPQGDEKHQREGLFPGAEDGWCGYVMRVLWIWRNPGYNFQRQRGVLLPDHEEWSVTWDGNQHISDKYKVPGYYFARFISEGRLEGFEFYLVWPWGFGKCFRARLGWKFMTDKFERYRFAPLVNTINPFKSYGDS